MTRHATVLGSVARPRVWLAGLVIALLGLSVPAAAQISDDFSAAELDTVLWKLVDPRGDGQVTLDPGLINLHIPAGIAHDASETGNNTLRLVQSLPDTDLFLETRFESQPTEPGQEQGLMVLQDEGSYVRFSYWHNGERLHLIWASVVDHQVLEKGHATVAATTTLDLRLIRLGDQWIGAHRNAGGTWFSSFEFSHQLQVDQGGVFAATSSPSGLPFPYYPFEHGNDKAGGAPTPAHAVAVDYFFDTNDPIVPEDGSLTYFVINSNAPSTQNTAVTLFNTSPIAVSMQFSNDGVTYSGWVDFAATYSWDLGPGEGLRTVYGQFRDAEGIVFEASDDIELDAVLPTASFVINDDATSTNLTAVTLTSTTNDVVSMQFSNDGVTYSGWVEFAATYAWDLGAGEGLRTVYGQFRDAAGNIVDTSDDIELDTTLPTASFVINDDAAITNVTAVTLTTTSADADSMQFSNDGVTYSGWVEFATTYPWDLGAGEGLRTVYGQFRDTAGNIVDTSDDIELDTTLPTATFVINDDAAITNLTAVTLTTTSADADSMQFSNDGVTYSGWVEFATTYPWDLGAGEGLRTVYGQFRDTAGNIVETTDDIELDTTQSTRAFGGLEAFYLFRDDTPGVVFDYAGGANPYHLTQIDTTAVTWLPGQGLRLDSPTLVKGIGPATNLNATIMASGALTLEAWLDPETADQSGPARIMTLSENPTNRNATLSHGQWNTSPNDLFNVRLRTTEQSLNGEPEILSPGGSLTGALQHVVYTRDAGGSARIYVDGSEVASSTTGGDFSNWDPTYALAFGGEWDDSRHWLGALHLAAIYSRALDATEVADNFATGPGGGEMPARSPMVILHGVTPGAAFEFTDTIAISAVAGDADGTITSVDFWVDDQMLHRDETAPYEFNWANPAVGSRLVRAVAVDDDSLTTTTYTVPIHVGAPASFQQALTFSDAFFDAELDAPWTLTDTSGGAGTSQIDGSVHLTLPAVAQSPWDSTLAVFRAHQNEANTDLALDMMIDNDAWIGDGFVGLELADDLGAAVRFVATRNQQVWTLSWGSAATGSPTVSDSLSLGVISGPVWLQVQRQGDTCELLHSTDGLDWVLTGSINQTLTMSRAGWLAGTLNGPATIAIDHVFNLASPIIPEDGAGGDLTGPVISQVSALGDLEQIDLAWVTDEPAYYRVDYGLTTAYEFTQIQGGFYSLNHQAVLPDLTPGQGYHLRLSCVDTVGNVTVSEDFLYYTDLTAVAAPGPAAGDVYREVEYGFGAFNDDWRVTDPDALDPGAAAFLPNSVLTVNVPDLTGAVRAEMVIDRWGGHPGTSGKKIRFNGGAWLRLPEPSTIDDSSPECFVYQDNPVIELPISQLASGPITMEGTADDQVCFSFNWGQWGWYGVVVRVYYDETVAHPEASFLAPAVGDTITDSAAISVDATSTGAVDLVHVLARYDGVVADGDGDTTGWHRRYRREKYSNTLRLDGIVGTATAAPWDVTWDASWIPDQVDGSVALQARVRDDSGVWYVTELDSLSLNHSDGVVKLYSMLDVPRSFWVRIGATRTVTFDIPASDSLSLASEALMSATSWNGIDGGTVDINGVTVASDFGIDHFYSFDTFDLAPAVLTEGVNSLTIFSPTVHHGMEMLWPGPQIAVRYGDTPPVAAAGPGDVDGNGRADRQDAQLILEHVVGARTLNEAALSAADIDGNHRVTAVDAGLMLGLSGKTTVESDELPAVTATWDPAQSGRLLTGIERWTGSGALELVVSTSDLATGLQDVELAVAPTALVAWHAEGDSLRVAYVGAAPLGEIFAVNWHSLPGELTIGGHLDEVALAPVLLSSPDLPTRFELVGNYPNPFNPATTIAFNLPRTATVRLRVHDLRGRLVATLVDGDLPAGRHQVIWRGRDQSGRGVASGTFFYRLEMGGQQWTEKMLLLK